MLLSFRKAMLEIVLVLLCVALSFLSPYFLNIDNFLNILRNASMQGIIAAGMTLVIICGEIDLSVGSAVAFSGCLIAWLTKYLAGGGSATVGGIVLSVTAAILVGIMVGMFTGVIRVRCNVPTFIITLAWLTILKGAAQLLTNGFPISSFPSWYNFLGGGYVAGIPFPAIVFLLVFIFMHFISKYTTFGRAIYSVGGNMEAARLSGIRVARTKIAVMAIVSGLAALAGVMQASQIMAGSASTATGWELDVIASVIIGVKNACHGYALKNARIGPLESNPCV